ncbi:hypothetical protein [Actinophytocola sp. NPDC049390]|uniref:hypothetical protein n=1 Tax=Actinophytocola sp. NPDC049390 TaxID=3363894 RepID=UPI00379A6DCF
MAGAGRINRAIKKSRSLIEARNYRKALTHNRHAIGMMERVARFDALYGLTDRPTLAGLYYEQAGILAQLNEWEQAVVAAQIADHLYTDVDPTRGTPDLVAPKVRQFRAEHGDHAVVPFEERIGDAANARSFLALLLARHQGAAAESVERLGRNAIETFSELIQVGLAYDRDDLGRVRDQVSQARRLLTPELPSPAWRLSSADVLSASTSRSRDSESTTHATSRDQRLEVQAHLESCASHEAAGNYRTAFAENSIAIRILRDIRKADPDNRGYTVLMGLLYYREAILWEKNRKGKQAISAARSSVDFFEYLDPTERGRQSVADAVTGEPFEGWIGGEIRPEDLIADLVEARLLLARLLATYEQPGRRRDRNLRVSSLDPALSIKREFNIVAEKACIASRDLLDCSRRSWEDHVRVCELADEADRILRARNPDNLKGLSRS